MDIQNVIYAFGHIFCVPKAITQIEFQTKFSTSSLSQFLNNKSGKVSNTGSTNCKEIAEFLKGKKASITRKIQNVGDIRQEIVVSAHNECMPDVEFTDFIDSFIHCLENHNSSHSKNFFDYIASKCKEEEYLNNRTKNNNSNINNGQNEQNKNNKDVPFSFDNIINTKLVLPAITGIYLVFRLGEDRVTGSECQDNTHTYFLRVFPARFFIVKDDMYYEENYINEKYGNHTTGLIRNFWNDYWIFGTDTIDQEENYTNNKNMDKKIKINNKNEHTIGFLYNLHTNWNKGFAGTVSMINESNKQSSYNVIFIQIGLHKHLDYWDKIPTALSLEFESEFSDNYWRLSKTSRGEKNKNLLKISRLFSEDTDDTKSRMNSILKCLTIPAGSSHGAEYLIDNINKSQADNNNSIFNCSGADEFFLKL